MKALSIIVTLVTLALAGGANAQQSDRAKAESHYKRAIAYEELQQWTNAIVEYEAANRLFPDAEFHYLIAENYVKLDRKAEAVARYEQYLAASPSGRVSADAKAAIARLRAEMGDSGAPVAPSTAPATSTPSTTTNEKADPAGPAAKPTTTEATGRPRLPPAGPVGPAAAQQTGFAPERSPPASYSNLRTGAYAATIGGIGVLATGLFLVSGKDEVELGPKILIGAGAVGVAGGLALFVYRAKLIEGDEAVAIVPRVEGDVVALELLGRF